MQVEIEKQIRAEQVWDYWRLEESVEAAPSMMRVLEDCVAAADENLRDLTWETVLDLQGALMACPSWAAVNGLVLPIYQQCEHLDIREIGGFLMRRFDIASQ